ncbi:hypothetical protein [Microbispora sp. NPDC046933]|uniref:hypothetical protein n=1 Tax=Microbispora sp. NPDC046933 TaxID=3155618 RepID=UPI003409B4CC
MRRTALLLSGLLLGGLLTATPVSAATSAVAPFAAAPSAAARASGAAAPTAAVGRVKASPARHSGACPTTVGFSAVVAAKGKGTVRYRWVRGDGGKSAIRSIRVNGARKVVVKDRQTFDRTTSGWQAVEIVGKRGLSGKARFGVACTGPVVIWDTAHPLPAAQDEPLVAAAHVVVAPPVYDGVCPTTVTFRATIQVSRTPAKVGYRWIDSATGEGRLESISFPAGGPRIRQVILPMGVGDSTKGWKAVHIVGQNGHDSGRARYQVTCKTPPSSPPPSSPPPSSPPPSQPPAQKPATEITSLTPGDYTGTCTEPVDYQAAGRVTLPAGPAQKVTYRWTLGDAQWKYDIDFPAAAQPRVQDVTVTWQFTSKDAGSHTLVLKAEGATASSERSFTFACKAQPETPTLTAHYLLTPDYKGRCTTGITLHAAALVTTDVETEMQYRFSVDGKPGPLQKQSLKPGTNQVLSEVWDEKAPSNKTGTIRLEVLNHNQPVRTAPYTVACFEEDTSAAVRFRDVYNLAYYGDCVEKSDMSVSFTLAAAAGTEVTYRWLVEGKPIIGEAKTTIENDGVKHLGLWWAWDKKPSGPVRLEVLSHNKPSAEYTIKTTCQK